MRIRILYANPYRQHFQNLNSDRNRCVFFVSLFVEEIHIPGARPIMAPTNVGGGGGSVGVLTITWKVSIYNNPLYRKRAGKSLTVQISRFEII